MILSELLVKTLVDRYQVNDCFGVPGGVILALLSALDKADKMQAHLCYNEQAAGFAACGYAQSSGKIGVAYATKGPGISNMVTAIAEAYQESLPVLFITSHSGKNLVGPRFTLDQEVDYSCSFSNITKCSISIDDIDTAYSDLVNACDMALNGRKGPVFIDVLSSLWNKEVKLSSDDCDCHIYNVSKCDDASELLRSFESKLYKSKRPLLLIGDGIRMSDAVDELVCFSKMCQIPIISSRASIDIGKKCDHYYGYIGSHGCRYANFILEKSDFIISIGNRLSYPRKSASFAPMMDAKDILRIDIDENEFLNGLSNATNFVFDAKKAIGILNKLSSTSFMLEFKEWLDVCESLKSILNEEDLTEPVTKLNTLITKVEENVGSELSYVCDVGNNEFWFSRAYEYSSSKSKLYFSKSFGTLGCSIPKAIGVYYATRKPVICVVGDQGFQFNVQELNQIKTMRIPIHVVVLNNHCSRIISDHEETSLGKHIHVDESSGYFSLDISQIASGFGLSFVDSLDSSFDSIYKLPLLSEIIIDSNLVLTPNLPKGNMCSDLVPLLEKDVYVKCKEL